LALEDVARVLVQLVPVDRPAVDLRCHPASETARIPLRVVGSKERS
jgi:hypothetical protein